MVFSEKLSFLMRISNTTSKGLAEFLHVDPSRISQLKTGRRGRPRDADTLQSIANFFARYCSSASQRMALSESIGNATFSNQITAAELSKVIFHWLEDTPLPEPASFSDPSAGTPARHPGHMPAAIAASQKNFVFYGNEGKRDAVRLMYRHALEMEEPKTIYMCTEENPTWYYEDPAFLANQEHMRYQLVKKGFHIVHILDLNTSLNVSYENMLRWIPSYTTGRVAPYYYPRIRDGVFNHTLIAIPGEITLFTVSVANAPTSRITIVSTQKETVEEILAFVKDYLSICIPAMHIQDTFESAYRSVRELSWIPENRISKRLTLPPSCLPTELLMKYSDSPGDSERSMFARFYLEVSSLIDTELASFEDVEICAVATVQDVRSGKVRIEVPTFGSDTKEFYTPQTYAAHLKNVLQMLETHPGFHFVPIPYNENDYTSILIKQSKRAVLMNVQDGLITLDTQQSDLVKIFHEYLLRSIEYTDFRSPKGRQQIMGHIRALIHELEK